MIDATAYSRLVSDAAGLALGLEDAINQTDPHAVPELIATELPHLETITKQLQQTDCPAAATRAHQTLTDGMATFQDDLMNVCDEATLAASQSEVYQRGLLSPSIGRTDGGARMRWELSLSHGLADIKQAVSDLQSAGFTDSGLEPKAW